MSARKDADRPRGARVAFRAAILCTLLVISGHAFGDGVVLGLVASGGQGFAYGSYLDARAAALTGYGASSTGTPGTISPDLFLAWGPGLFAEIDLVDWLALRLEARYSFLGAAYIASTAGTSSSAGVPFDGYSASYQGVVVPLLLRARPSRGTVRLTAMAGPVFSFTVSPLTVVDHYAQSTTTAVFVPAALAMVQFGACAGAGLEIAAGTGVVLLEVRTDIMLSSIAAASGPVGGEIMSVPVFLALSYGFRLGGAGR